MCVSPLWGGQCFLPPHWEITWKVWRLRLLLFGKRQLLKNSYELFCVKSCWSAEEFKKLWCSYIHVYGNCWTTAWTSDWPPEASAESAAGAQVNTISPEWPLLDLPHLRADSHRGRIPIWRSFLLEPFCEPRTWVRSLFHFSFVMW